MKTWTHTPDGNRLFFVYTNWLIDEKCLPQYNTDGSYTPGEWFRILHDMPLVTSYMRYQRSYTYAVEAEKIEVNVNFDAMSTTYKGCGRMRLLAKADATDTLATNTTVSTVINGGICRHCNMFDEYPTQGDDGKICCWKCTGR